MAKSSNDNIEGKKKTRVIVRFPHQLEISMVQSNDLHQYELFQWLVIFFAPIASGFGTALATNPTKVLWWVTSVFTATTLLFAKLAVDKRKALISGNVTKAVNLDDFPHCEI